MTLEEWNIAFQFSSAVLLGLTFAVGAGAIITGYFINKRQAVRIATLGSEVVEANRKANERAGRLELEAARQREKAAKAESDLLELQQRVKPRMFTDDQRRSLIDALKRSSPKGLVTITCVLGDGEGFAFASQVDEILKAADWPTTGVNQSVFVPQNPVGLGIVVQSAATVPPFVGALQRAFGSVGLALPISELATLTVGTTQLWIGNKPQ